MEFDPKIDYSNVQDKEEPNNESEKADMLKMMEKVDKQQSKNKSSDSEDEDDDKDREKVILIINRFKNSLRFSKILNKIKIDTLDMTKMSMKKLNGLLDKIRFTLDNSQNNDLINTAIFAGIGSLEKLATNLQLAKLDGLTQNLMANEVFLDSIETLKIENNISLKFQDPKKRLMFELVKSVYMTHTINSLKENLGNISNISKPAENIDIYKTEE